MSKTVIFVLLLASALIGRTLVTLTVANPTPYDFYHSLGTVPPDSKTQPPIISIFAPENRTEYSKSTIPISFNVSVGESSTASSKHVQEIYCKADWQTSNISIYKFDADNNLNTPEPVFTQVSKTFDLTRIPDGNHSLIIYAIEKGDYYSHTQCEFIYNLACYYYFEINASSTVFFAVDTISPIVTIFLIQDGTFASSDVDLGFFVNEPTSKISYSLDRRNNVTVAGNTTLASLPAGEHNVTVYAWDAAGNVGASETIYFRTEPFPIVPVTVASVIAIAVIIACLVSTSRNANTKQ